MNRRIITRVAAAVGAAALVGLTPGHAVADSSVLSDPNAKGFIGLCDSNNHNVTGGNIHDAPFVWKAVASQGPPAAYTGRGENAVLNIYQPRPGIGPGQWSGDSLTSASFYDQPAAPAVQATYKDIPLSVVVNEFPPLVDGLYQLRIYYGKLNYALYSATYPSTFIRVTGDRWTVVTGGTVNCAAVSANSAEVVYGDVSVKAAYGSPLPSAHGKPVAKPSSNPKAHAAVSSAASASGTSTSAALANGAVKPSSGGGAPIGVVIGVVVVVIVGGCAAGYVWWWRRQPQIR